MKNIWLLVALIPTTVLAISYDTESLPYSDVPSDLETQVAISTLTDLGVFVGNPDGTIRSNRSLNRAEFVAISARLLPEDGTPVVYDCFPDIRADAWYAEPACHLKTLGIVRGNALPGLTSRQYPFAPERNVTYEEALKILTGIFGVPLLEMRGEWYAKYVLTAESLGIHLRDSGVGQPLTRGQMARLTVQYLAYSKGELEDLWTAQTNASSSHSSHVSSVSHVSSSWSSSTSSSSSAIYDHLLYDMTTDDAVLVLGQVTHILAAASLFASDEAIIVDDFLIDLVAGNSSLEAMNVYDDHGKFLGRATLDASVAGGTRYRLGVKSQNIILPRRDDFSFYVRGVLRPEDQGGVSGGSIEVDEMGITGIGFWSNRDYTELTVGETFGSSNIARSAIMEIRNAGDTSTVLSQGTDVELGSFYFAGITGHSSATVKITAIDFTLGVTGGTTVTNPIMRVSGASDTHTCSIAGSTLTCSGLSDTFGEVDDGSRTLRVYGDIDVPDASMSASVQLSINDPGSIGSAGDITWTDGTTTFNWIDLNQRPIARGTYYSY